MKQIKIKRVFGLFAILLSLSAVSPVLASVQYPNDYIVNKAGDKFVGGWSYTVEGAPEGYKEGLLVIIKEGDSYKVQVQRSGGTSLGENVKVSGSTITFNLMVEGDKVGVNLTTKGDTIAGTSTSSSSTLKINGKRTISMD